MRGPCQVSTGSVAASSRGAREFVFRSEDVADWLTRRLEDDPDRSPEREIQHWIETRDDRLNVPTDVPSFASGFEFIADEMVRKGFGDVRCRRCDALIPNEALIYADDDGEQMGWNFNRILCPERHPLLVIAMVHMNLDFDAWVGRPDEKKGNDAASRPE